MLDAVIDTQPVISRFGRSKDNLLSSFSENSSKLSLLGLANPLGLFSAHRRVHSDLETSPPSFRDYLLLSGGGLEPAFKFSPDAKTTSARRSSSSRRNSSLTLKDSRLSVVSTHEFSDEKSDLELTHDLCPGSLLTPPATPSVASREVPNSISSVFSILISTLAPPKTTRGHHLGSPRRQVGNVKECNELRFVSIMSTPSSRMQFSASPSRLEDWEDGDADQPATIFEMKFSPPSFIRPRGRKLIARREPSPMVCTPSLKSPQRDHFAYAHVKECRDEGIALSRTPVERDVIPEEDEALEESQIPHENHVAPQDHISRHDQMGFHDQLGHDGHMAHSSQSPHHDHISHYDQMGPNGQMDLHHNQTAHHPQISHYDQIHNHSDSSYHDHIPHHSQSSHNSQGSYHSQRSRHGQMPLIYEHDGTLELEHIPAKPPAQTPEQERMRVAEEIISNKIAQQIDYIVEAAAMDDNSRSEWRAYMDNYSKGSFNISTPPAPPSASPKLQFLPSIFPRTEAERISVFKDHRLSWNKVTAERLSQLLAFVMAKFGMNSGAVSFFNNKNEYIKAERGYNTQNISRSTSIAAHGLLSADVFVVPDTEKDWRFQGHPLVIAGPKIRFFAGAPLLGEGGQPIGMLSIFSDSCRPDFSPFDRRELADFAAEAMKDLKLGSEYTHTPSEPSASKFEGGLLAEGSYHAKSLNVAGLDNADGHELDADTPSLPYHKVETPSTRFGSSLMTRDKSLQRNHNSISRPSHSNLRRQDEFEQHRYHQYGGLEVDSGSTLYKLDALSISDFAPPSPRPFSSSDVSSIHQHPTNTPVHSQLAFQSAPGLEFSLQLLRSLSENAPDNDGQSLISSNRIARRLPSKTILRAHTPESPLPLRVSGQRDFLPSPGLNDSSLLPPSRPSSREDARAQAALICSRTARRLGYDLVYAVELNPSLDAIDETKILEPGTLPIRILAAYGMNEPFRPDPQVHVDALRSKGFYFWQAPPNANNYPGGYQSGCLIAIPTQGGVQYMRTSGIVIGAFRKQSPGKGITFETTDAELQALLEAGSEVKNLFWATADSSSRQAPPGPFPEATPEPYPAHEAVQVGEYPRSLYQRNMYAVSRQESRAGSPYPYHSYAQDRGFKGQKPTSQGTPKHKFNPPMATYRGIDQRM